MTKSTITRERAEQLANFKGAPVTRQEEQELARIALAAMDSEPYGYVNQFLYEQNGVSGLSNDHEYYHDSKSHIPLYRHAQSAPVVSADLLHTAASAIEDLLTTKDRTGAGVWFDLPFRLRSVANAQPAPVIPPEMTACQAYDLLIKKGGVMSPVDAAVFAWNACRAAMLAAAQPATVVPDEKPMPNPLSMYAVDAVAAIAEVKGWNACRAAMLQAEPVTTANKLGNNPAQSPIDHGYRKGCECLGCKTTVRICAELAGNSPVIPDGYVMVPKEPTQAMCAAFNDSDYGRKSLRERYVAMLAAAPQEVKP